MRVISPPAPQADSRFWTLWRGLTDAHTALYKLTRGRIGGRALGARFALVESVGRRSGKLRTHPLICEPDGENLVIVASKGGVDAHPAWYLNLMADPETAVWWQGRRRRVHAREADRDERERLWPKMTAVWAPYEDYQRRTERLIPIVILEPAG
jgi:F420H(2)-dependent quinone reductase